MLIFLPIFIVVQHTPRSSQERLIELLILYHSRRGESKNGSVKSEGRATRFFWYTLGFFFLVNPFEPWLALLKFSGKYLGTNESFFAPVSTFEHFGAHSFFVHLFLE